VSSFFSIVVDFADESDCKQQFVLHNLFRRVWWDVALVEARVRLGQMLIGGHTTGLQRMDALLLA